MDLNKYLRHIPNLITVANMVLGTLVLFSAISQKGRNTGWQPAL